MSVTRSRRIGGAHSRSRARVCSRSHVELMLRDSVRTQSYLKKKKKKKNNLAFSSPHELTPVRPFPPLVSTTERVRAVKSRARAGNYLRNSLPAASRFIKTLITGVYACARKKLAIRHGRDTTTTPDRSVQPCANFSTTTLHTLLASCTCSVVGARACVRELQHAPDIYLQGCTSRLRC